MPEATVNGIRLEYELTGTGEPVVIICGLGQVPETWHLYQVPALTEASYQVLTFSNRGMLPSESPPSPYSIDDMVADAVGLLDHLGWGPSRVIGHSMGGFIAGELARTRPDLVRAVVLMGSACRFSDFIRTDLRTEVDLIRSGLELPTAWDACLNLGRLFAPTTLHDDTTFQKWFSLFTEPAEGPAWEDPGRLGQHEAVLAWMEDEERANGWLEIEVPSLVMTFEHDYYFPPFLVRQTAEAMPRGEYVEIADAGHAGRLERPDAVNTALLGFLTRH